jgi:hypothetical protein
MATARHFAISCPDQWSDHCALMEIIDHPFQDVSAVLNRFGPATPMVRTAYRSFLEEGLTHDRSDDQLLRLVRNCNAGVEAERKVSCWVIGDKDFVKKAISQTEGKRLRISRFEKEGGDLDLIAAKVGALLDVPGNRLHFRCRGGKESDARKVFAYVATREYWAPSRMIADYCHIGIAAVSSLAGAGHDVVKQRGIDISLF